MPDYLSKLDFGLQRIYLRYLEDIEATATTRSITVSMRYSDNLEEIEALGFDTARKRSGGQASGALRLANLEAIASHPNVISLSAGIEPRLCLDSSVKDIRARAATTADVGSSALWHVDPATGSLIAAGGATGRGVIIGIIDTGIDISHPVFQHHAAPVSDANLAYLGSGANSGYRSGRAWAGYGQYTVALHLWGRIQQY